MMWMAFTSWGSAECSQPGAVTAQFHGDYPVINGAHIKLKNINGDLTVQGWDKNIVKVEAVTTACSQSELAEVRVDVHASSEEVVIDTIYSKSSDDESYYKHRLASVAYKVFLPHGVTVTKLESVNGNIEIKAVDSKVTATSVTGMILANGLTGTANLSTVTGELRADIGSGNHKNISLSSVSGTIKGQLSTEPLPAIDAETVLGEINNNLGLTPTKDPYAGQVMRLDGVDGKLLIRNVNGNIMIERQTAATK